MKNIRNFIAILGLLIAIVPSSNASASVTHQNLVNDYMSKDEIMSIVKENNLNLEFDDKKTLDELSKKDLVDIVNDLMINPRAIDGKTYVKRYVTDPIQLKYVSGSSANAYVYATVVFETYEDQSGKSITAIRSVTSSLTKNGITGSEFTQDRYVPESFSPCNQYTISARGIYSKAGVGNERVTFSFKIKPTYGSQWN